MRIRAAALSFVTLLLVSAPGGAEAAPWTAALWSPTSVPGSLALAERADGGVVLLLGHESASEGLQCALRAFGPDGELLWSQSYGGPGDDRPLDLASVPGEGLVLLMESADPVDGRRRLGIHSLDAAGQPQWSLLAEPIGELSAAQVVASADGTLFVAAAPVDNAVLPKVLLLRLSASGSHAWTRSFSGRIGPSRFGGLAVAGEDSLLLAVDDLMVGLDGAGSVAWSSAYALETGPSLEPLAVVAGVGRLGFVANRVTGEPWAWVFVDLGPFGELAAPITLLRRYGIGPATALGADGSWATLSRYSLDDEHRTHLDVIGPGPDGQVESMVLVADERTQLAVATPAAGGPVSARSAGDSTIIARHEPNGGVRGACEFAGSWPTGVERRSGRALPRSVEDAPVALTLDSVSLPTSSDGPLLSCHENAAVNCSGIEQSPERARAFEPVTLTLVTQPEVPGLIVDWDLDGDGLHELRGNPIEVLLPEGLHRVRAIARDPTAPELPCESGHDLEVVLRFPPPAISERRLGQLPLRFHQPGFISFMDAGAAGYASIVAPLGSWFSDAPPADERCTRLDPRPLLIGSLGADVDLEPDSWFVVVQLGDDGDVGLSGQDSFGGERESRPSWPACLP